MAGPCSDKHIRNMFNTSGQRKKIGADAIEELIKNFKEAIDGDNYLIKAMEVMQNPIINSGEDEIDYLYNIIGALRFSDTNLLLSQ